MAPTKIPVGVRASCDRCGRTVWLKRIGTMGSLGVHPNAPVFQWCARKGTKPTPRDCPVSDGWPTTYHSVRNYETMYYGEPDA